MYLEFYIVDYLKYLLSRHEPRVVVPCSDDNGTTLYECPSCHRTFGSEEFFEFYYCPRCGQALDW